MLSKIGKKKKKKAVSIMVDWDAPFVLPFNLKPVKRPQFNKGASAQHTRTPENSAHLYI